MAMVKLRYDISPGLRPVTPAEAIRIKNIKLFEGELLKLGMDLVSDVMTTGDSKITRTITLKTNDLGDSLWSGEEELKSATRGLYRAALNLKYPGSVEALEPEVTI